MPERRPRQRYCQKLWIGFAQAAYGLTRHAQDRGVLLTFYTFPAEHWMHIRTTNPIESTFATVRLRTKKTKGAGSRLARNHPSSSSAIRSRSSCGR